MISLLPRIRTAVLERGKRRHLGAKQVLRHHRVRREVRAGGRFVRGRDDEQSFVAVARANHERLCLGQPLDVGAVLAEARPVCQSAYRRAADGSSFREYFSNQYRR